MSVEGKLECLDVKLGRILSLIEPALGSQDQQVGTAAVAQLRSSDEPADLDFVGALGRAASSFTLTNLGNIAAVYLRKHELQAESTQGIGPIYLLPNTTRTFHRKTEVVRVVPTDDGPVWVQVDAL